VSPEDIGKLPGPKHPLAPTVFEAFKHAAGALERLDEDARARVLVALAYLLGVEDVVKRNLTQWG
jgi:hypothetical protein